MAERCDQQVEEIRKLRKLKNIDVVAPYWYSLWLVGAYANNAFVSSELLSLFLHNELIDIDWFVKKYKKRFIDDLSGLVCNFDMDTDEGQHNWQTFLDRITEYVCSVVWGTYCTLTLLSLEYPCYFAALQHCQVGNHEQTPETSC